MNRSAQGNLVFRRLSFVPAKTGSDKAHALRAQFQARGTQVLALLEFLASCRGGDVLAVLSYSGSDPQPTKVRGQLRAGSIGFDGGAEPTPVLGLSLIVVGDAKSSASVSKLQTFLVAGALASVLDIGAKFTAAQEDLPFDDPATKPAATPEATRMDFEGTADIAAPDLAKAPRKKKGKKRGPRLA